MVKYFSISALKSVVNRNYEALQLRQCESSLGAVLVVGNQNKRKTGIANECSMGYFKIRLHDIRGVCFFKPQFTLIHVPQIWTWDSFLICTCSDFLFLSKPSSRQHDWKEVKNVNKPLTHWNCCIKTCNEDMFHQGVICSCGWVVTQMESCFIYKKKKKKSLNSFFHFTKVAYDKWANQCHEWVKSEIWVCRQEPIIWNKRVGV